VKAGASWFLCSGGEEVDQQFVDAFSLVVMFVAGGLGEEVGIAFPQRTSVGAENGEALAGVLLGRSYRGAV